MLRDESPCRSFADQNLWRKDYRPYLNVEDGSRMMK